jgi:CPA2 family monovalent cation:H+ antiporter-2
MEGNFLQQTLIYLAAAVICVPIAKKLGLGSVLGYLLAGIIIGPFMLGIVGADGQDIMHFAEFGVVMMLFLVGLELEPELLWRLKSSILGLGGLQVSITAVVIGAIAMLMNVSWNEAVALGLILAMSSTAIVIQTLNEKGLMRTSAGNASFSVLLFQDISVIPILAILPLLAMNAVKTATNVDQHEETWVKGMPGWAHTLYVLGAVAVVILVGRFLVKPLLRIIAKTRLREMFTASALLMVVAITVLMTKVGLSPALGTFLAGVVLANSEYRHELESDIDPFKGLLLGLFFIAVGASIDFRLVLQQPGTIILFVLGIMIVKGLVLFGLGKIFKLKMDQNLLFAFSLSQVGEFAFVLLSFTRQEGILPDETIRLMMAIVAISMAITPLVMLINEKWILPIVGTKEEETREADAIHERNPVIIAGFGHFGSTVGRFLRANGVLPTVLEVDSDQVDLLRRMGFNVYYGDPSRYDLLKAAGAEHAKIIIIAIDAPEKTLVMVETIKKHFPNLQILVRARNRFDAYDLMDAGMLHIYRESLETSVRVGTDALRMLGFRAYRTKRAAQIFIKNDEKALKGLAAVRDNIKEYVVNVRQRIEEQEKIIQADVENISYGKDNGWDADALREDVLKHSPRTPTDSQFDDSWH